MSWLIVKAYPKVFRYFLVEMPPRELCSSIISQLSQGWIILMSQCLIITEAIIGVPNPAVGTVHTLSHWSFYNYIWLIFCACMWIQLCVFTYMCGYVCTTECMERSEGSLWESALSFWDMGSGDWYQGVRLGCGCLSPLNHFAGPINSHMFLKVGFPFYTYWQDNPASPYDLANS